MTNPESYLEKVIAGQVEPVSHLEKVIAQYSGGASPDAIKNAVNDYLAANPVQAYDDTQIKADIKTHTDNTNIHVTTSDKTKWDKVTDKVDKSVVADVPHTTISKFNNETNYAVGQEAYNNYNVANGECEVTLCVRAVSPNSASTALVKTDLPKPISAKYFALNNWSGTDAIMVQITKSGSLYLKNGTANGLYMGSFKYKVAE